MKTPKNEEVNFINININKNNNKSRKKTKKKKKEKAVEKQHQLFDLDNEIVIGIKKAKKKKQNKNPNQDENNKKSKKVDLKENSLNEKTKKRIKSFVKWVFIITVVVGGILFLMLSPLFKVESIMVKNNSKITAEEIISLSGITIGDNIFRINQFKVEKNMKQNPYIESIKIDRNLPDTVTIIIKERKPTYIIEKSIDEFVYINNQGYIVEIRNEPDKLPRLINYKTSEFSEGSRLNDEDLKKLEIVLKIMEVANANQIGHLITEINIKDRNNLILRLEEEKKTVYIGDASDINTKILYIKATLEDEKGVEGELFMDGKTNKQGEFLFREKV